MVLQGHHQEHWIYDSYTEYYNTIQNHLVEYCLQAGYSLIVRPYDETEELKHWLQEWDVDGVIWHGYEANLDWVVERFPTLQLIRHAVIEADAVTFHVEEAIAIGLEYLRQLGHKRIVCPFRRDAKELLSIKRYQAYEAYISRHQLAHWESFYNEREL